MGSKPELVKTVKAAGWAAKISPGDLEEVLRAVRLDDDPRLLTSSKDHEDAAVVRFPPGKALVQTVDFLTPIVNDPFKFGQIAAANALSDVYAMGGEPYTAMNIVGFPVKAMPKEYLKDILRGGYDKIKEAGAVLAGGHSVEDDEIKYGLSVTGIVDPDGFASNKGLNPGDVLVLTKPIGTGVVATALKGDIGDADALEKLLCKWAARLNSAGAQVIRDFGLTGATDVTGFGLGGHILEMAEASNVSVEISLSKVPFMQEALEFAGFGLIPAGSHSNKKFCSSLVSADEGIDVLKFDLIFDAQTSGGLVLSVPEKKLPGVVKALVDAGDLAEVIGHAAPRQRDAALMQVIA